MQRFRVIAGAVEHVLRVTSHRLLSQLVIQVSQSLGRILQFPFGLLPKEQKTLFSLDSNKALEKSTLIGLLYTTSLLTGRLHFGSIGALKCWVGCVVSNVSRVIV